MAKNYIDNLSEETKKGMMEKAEQGIFPSYAPLGYVNVERDGKRYIEPDPNLAPLVRKLFEWYSTGNHSLLEVTRKVHAEGLAYRKSDGKVQKSIVYKILNNPVYYGDFNWAGKRYRGIHEPLVSKELWDKVQAVFADKGKYHTHRQKHEWAFQGLVWCGHCGLAMTPELKKGKYIYYHCTGFKGKCPDRYVREEELSRQFGEALKALRLDDEVLDWVVTALKESHADEKRYHDEAIATLQDQYQKLQNRLDAMYVDKLDRRITQEAYDGRSEEWRREQLDILHGIESHQRANGGYMDMGIRTLELAGQAYALYEKQDVHEKRRLLNSVLSNSFWRSGELIPNYRKPFDLIVNSRLKQVELTGGEFDKVAKNEIWLPGLGGWTT